MTWSHGDEGLKVSGREQAKWKPKAEVKIWKEKQPSLAYHIPLFKSYQKHNSAHVSCIFRQNNEEEE